jgi:hypothetical protein
MVKAREKLVAAGLLAVAKNRKGRPIYRNGQIVYKITEKGIALDREFEAFRKEYNQNVAIQLMQFLSIDQLARYNDALETIDELASGLEPADFESAVLKPGSLGEALLTKAEITPALARLARAWKKLEPLAFQAIADLVAEGLMPSTCGGEQSYFFLLYQHILEKAGGSIKGDQDFQGVLMLQFLKRLLVARLPGLAIEYRERGQPMVAQAVEELAEFEANY